MKLNSKYYKSIFKGYSIIDASVRQKSVLYFLLEQNVQKNAKTRVVTCIGEDILPAGMPPWNVTTLTNMVLLKSEVVFAPKPQCICVSLNGHVYVNGSGDNLLEDDLDSGNSYRSPDNLIPICRVPLVYKLVS